MLCCWVVFVLSLMFYAIVLSSDLFVPGPRKLILIECVSKVRKYLSNGTLPLLFTTASAIPVHLVPLVRIKPKQIISVSMKQ